MNITQEQLTQTQRHGYAVYSASNILISWVISLDLAHQIPGAAIIVNVQNGTSIPVTEKQIPISDSYRAFEKITCFFCSDAAVYRVEDKQSFQPDFMDTCETHVYKAFS
jgi:hypothetical protein